MPPSSPNSCILVNWHRNPAHRNPATHRSVRRICRGPVMKPVGKPDAANPHVRFDERGGKTGRYRKRASPRPSPTTQSRNSVIHRNSHRNYD